MGKKKNYTPIEEEDDFYLPDDESSNETNEEEVSSEETVKTSKEDRKLELAILKETNRQLQLENEAKKLENEQAEAEWKHEFEEKKFESDSRLEERKVAVSEKANDIAEAQIKSDEKKSKKDRILGYVKAGVGIAGVIFSAAFSWKKFKTGAIFEETDSWRTATGKDGCKSMDDSEKDLKNLDKKF